MKTMMLMILSFAHVIACAQVNSTTDTTVINQVATFQNHHPIFGLGNEIKAADQAICHETDSIGYNIRHPKSYRSFMVPLALIGYGVMAQFNTSLKKLDHGIHRNINQSIHRRITLDDYLQYAPAANVYALDLMGVKAKHSFGDRTMVMVTSYVLTAAVVQTMKHSVGVTRPDGSNTKSFPSGHTATAFVGAHILYKEYAHHSPWIGIGGYVAATATGALRMVNKKHWLSDVVAGAGIGIASVELGYLLLPRMHQILGDKQAGKQLAILPVVSQNQYGLSLLYRW